MPEPRGTALTAATREGLRKKLDGIVATMIRNGQPSIDVQAVVDDFKARNFLDTPAEPSWSDLIGTGLGAAAKGLVMAPVNLLRAGYEAATTPGPEALGNFRHGAAGAGANLVNNLLVQPSVVQFHKMTDAYGKGRYSEMAGHAAGMVPLLGPAAAAIGEKIGTGDPTQIAEGLGETAAMVGTGPAMRAAAPLTRATGRATAALGAGMWKRAAKIPENLTRATQAFRDTGELAAGDAQIADTVLSRGRGGLTERNARALLQERAQAGREVGTLREQPSTATMPAHDMLGAVDDEIARMRLAQQPQSDINAALARRQELAGRWTDEQTKIATEPDGPVTINADTADAVIDQTPLEEFTTGPRLDPAIGAWRHELPSGGFAGEYSPIKSTSTTTTSLRPLSSSMVEGMRTTNPGSGVGAAIRRTATKWQDRNVPGLSVAKARYGELRPASEVMNKGAKRVGQEAPLSIPQAVLAPFGGASALAYLQRSGPLSHAGQWTYNTGKLMQKAGRAMPGIRTSPFPVQGAGFTAGAELDEQEAARQAMIDRLRGR